MTYGDAYWLLGERGVTNDGRDATAALQNNFRGSDRANYTPSGEIIVTDSIRLDDGWGRGLQGSGSSNAALPGYGAGTRIIWLGPPDRPLFVFNSCQKIWLCDFDVYAYYPLKRVVESRTMGPARPSSQHLYENLTFHGPGIREPFAFVGGDNDPGGGFDGNNDLMTFRNVACAGRGKQFGDKAWVFDHVQTTGHRFDVCFASYFGYGVYANKGTSFTWDAGSFAGNHADFAVGGGAPINVRGAFSEMSDHFLVNHPETNAASMIHLDSCHFNGNGMSDGGNYIDVDNLSLMLTNFNAFNMTGKNAAIKFTRSQYPTARFVMNGGSLHTSPLLYPNPFTGLPPDSERQVVVSNGLVASIRTSVG